MSNNNEVKAIHTGSYIDHSARRYVSEESAAVSDFTNIHNVATGVDMEGGKQFELTLSGQAVKQLSVWSGSQINGVQVIFEDGTKKQAGTLSHGKDVTVAPGAELIEFHPDELITNTSIYRLEGDDEELGKNVKVVTALKLETDFGQKYMAVSLPFAFASMAGADFLKSIFDDTKGKLIGVYGMEAPNTLHGKKIPKCLFNLGLILALPEDKEYQFLNVKYDISTYKYVGDRMLSLKEQIVENNSSATVNSQVSFSHNYSVTKNWGNVAGLKVGAKTNIKAGIPFLAEGKIEVSAEGSYQHSWGGSVTDSKTDTWSATISAPPHSEFRGVGSVEKALNKEVKKILEDAKVLAAQNGIVFKEKILRR